MTSTGPTLMSAIMELTDTIVADFDVEHFAGRIAAHSADLPGVAAAGVMLADPRGALGVSAASTPEARALSEYQLHRNEGPGIDAYRTGRYVRRPDLGGPDPRWPRFSASARAAGFAAVHALPLRLRAESVGAVNLFGPDTGDLPAQSVSAARAIADAAGIGLVHRRLYDHHEQVTDQLRHALDSRVVIEQAKGLLAERRNVPVTAAFDLLRAHARDHNTKIGDVAARVVDGTLDPAPPPPPHARRRVRRARATS